MRDSSGHGRRLLLISLARYVYRVTATSATPGVILLLYYKTRSKLCVRLQAKDSKLTRHVRYHSQCFSPITWYENIATRFCKDNILGVRTDFYLIYSGPLCPLIKIIKTKPLLVLHYAGSRCGGPNIAA